MRRNKDYVGRMAMKIDRSAKEKVERTTKMEWLDKARADFGRKVSRERMCTNKRSGSEYDRTSTAQHKWRKYAGKEE